IAEALAAFGVGAARCGCGHEAGRGAFLCFEHQTPGDLLLAGHKVVGSAQRRRAGALLQHGSILLAASPHAPQLPGARAWAGVDVASAALAEEFTRAFARAIGWELRPADWTGPLRDRTAAITAEKYRRPAWNDRR